LTGATPDFRVLVSVRPFRGHLHSLVPLTAALQRAGHQVTVATSAEVATTLEEASLSRVAAGIHPRVAEVRFPGENPAYGPSALRTKIEDLLGIIAAHPPNVMIRESTDLAAAVAAEIAGVTCLTFGISSMIPRFVWRKNAGESLALLRGQYGLPADPELDFLFSSLYIDVLPPAMEAGYASEVPDLRYVRYEPWDGAATARRPPWLDALGHRPVVLATLGTVYNKQRHVIRTFLQALEAEDVDVLLTLGDDQPRDKIGPVPDNVQVAQYLPHSMLLPHCDLLLCHGGFNTVMGALCQGVPMVCVPIAGDQIFNAARCEQLGYGLRLGEGSDVPATPATIRSAVRRALGDETFRTRADDIRCKIAALPALETLVPEIEVRGGRSPVVHQS